VSRVHLTLTRAALLLAGLGIPALATAPPASAQTPSPELAPMALRPADFPYGGKVIAVHTGSDGPRPTHEVTLLVGDRASQRRTPGFAFESLEAADSADTAQTDLAQARRAFGSRRGRSLLAREYATGGGVRTKDVRVRRPRTVRAGDGAFDVSYTVRKQRVTGAVAVLRVDRVEAIVVLTGRTGSRLMARRDSLLRVAARRIAAGLAPRSPTAPAVG
jgi:hypothetical protein